MRSWFGFRIGLKSNRLKFDVIDRFWPGFFHHRPKMQGRTVITNIAKPPFIKCALTKLHPHNYHGGAQKHYCAKRYCWRASTSWHFSQLSIRRTANKSRKKKRGIKKVKNMEINLLGLVACFRLQYTCIFNKILKEQNVKLNKQEQNTK